MNYNKEGTYEDGIDVEFCGIGRVDQLIDDHLVNALQQVRALHHVCLRVHLKHVLVIYLALDHIEVLVEVNEFQDQVDYLVTAEAVGVLRRLHWLRDIQTILEKLEELGISYVFLEKREEILTPGSQDGFVDPTDKYEVKRCEQATTYGLAPAVSGFLIVISDSVGLLKKSES